MSRSYSTFRERQPFTDGWKEANYSATAPSDHVRHPFTVDAEGVQMPIIRHVAGSKGETYMIKAEIVEHSIVPAPYRYGWQQGGENFRDTGAEGRHHDLGSNYLYREKFEEFINKVVSEAGRGRTATVAPPLSPAWHSVPKRNVLENNREYGDERNLRRDYHKKLNDGPNWDRHNEPYLNNRGTNTHPTLGSNRDVYHEFYERRRGNEGPNARSHPLSKPTNEISTAMEFQKEPIKPSYGNGKEKEKEFSTSAYNEASRPAKTIPLCPTRSNMSGPDTKVEPKDYDSEDEEEESLNPLSKRDELKMVNNRRGGGVPAMEFLKESIKPSYGNGKEKEKEFNTSAYNEASRPTKTIPLGATRWRPSSNMSGADTKVEPKDYDSEEEEEESRNPLGKRDELKMVNNRGGEKPLENKDGYENPKRNAAAVQFVPTVGKKKAPETIDSREAGRRYGKLPPRKMEEEEYKGTITSREAMRKYNGAVVP